MWGKGKRKNEENFISDEDSLPASKKSVKKNSEDSDSIFVCEISKNRRLSVRKWKGKVYVDIREFYEKDGKEFPGKKGVSLSLDQWNILKDRLEEMDKEIQKS